MSIVYVGLDLGSSNFQQVALNHDGVSRVNRDFTTSEANLVKAFSDLKGEIHVHLEAGELAPWAASIIAPLVERVVCSHPQSNAWIAKDADKCDRVDAYKLAELLRLNRFKEVHYAPDQRRQLQTTGTALRRADRAAGAAENEAQGAVANAGSDRHW